MIIFCKAIWIKRFFHIYGRNESAMDGFEEFSAMTVSRNRCAGYMASGKRCRTRLREDQYLYCCDAHRPINTESLEEGCACCMEKMVNHKDVIHFRCNHLVHRECYYEWMKGSMEESPICILCRAPVWTALQPKKRPVKEYLLPIDFLPYQVTNLLSSIQRDQIIEKEEVEKQKKRMVFGHHAFL